MGSNPAAPTIPSPSATHEPSLGSGREGPAGQPRVAERLTRWPWRWAARATRSRRPPGRHVAKASIDARTPAGCPRRAASRAAPRPRQSERRARPDAAAGGDPQEHHELVRLAPLSWQQILRLRSQLIFAGIDLARAIPGSTQALIAASSRCPPPGSPRRPSSACRASIRTSPRPAPCPASSRPGSGRSRPSRGSRSGSRSNRSMNRRSRMRTSRRRMSRRTGSRSRTCRPTHR